MKRSEIVPQARTWLGTLFKHQGRLKKTAKTKGATDCIGTVGGTANELGYEYEDITDYAHSPDAMMFKERVEKYLDKIEFSEIKPGDILTFAFHKEPQHIAFVTEVYPQMTILHAYSRARMVVEHNLSDEWKNGTIARIAGAYKFKNIEEDI